MFWSCKFTNSAQPRLEIRESGGNRAYAQLACSAGGFGGFHLSAFECLAAILDSLQIGRIGARMREYRIGNLFLPRPNSPMAASTSDGNIHSLRQNLPALQANARPTWDWIELNINNNLYYPTVARRVQITPKTSTDITRNLYSRGPVKQVCLLLANQLAGFRFPRQFRSASHTSVTHSP